MINSPTDRIKRMEHQETEATRRHPGPLNGKVLGITRAAGGVREIIERRPIGGESPITWLAEALGTTVVDHEAPWTDGRVFDATPIVDDDKRDRLGYGNLPSDLIVLVEKEIGQLMPDYAEPKTACLVASQVMHIVSGNPLIYPSDLRYELSDRELGLPPVLSRNTAVALDGVITLTHELTAQYIAVNGKDT